MNITQEITQAIDNGLIQPSDLAAHLKITEEKLMESLATNHFSANQRSSMHVYLKMHHKSLPKENKYDINQESIKTVRTNSKYKAYKNRFNDYLDTLPSYEKLSLKEIITITYLVPNTRPSFWLASTIDLNTIMQELDKNPQIYIDGFKAAYKPYLTIYPNHDPRRIPLTTLHRKDISQALTDRLGSLNPDLINQFSTITGSSINLAAKFLNTKADKININAHLAHALHTFCHPETPFAFPFLDWLKMPLNRQWINLAAFPKVNGINSSVQRNFHTTSIKTFFKELSENQIPLKHGLSKIVTDHEKEIVHLFLTQAIKQALREKVALPNLIGTTFATLLPSDYQETPVKEKKPITAAVPLTKEADTAPATPKPKTKTKAATQTVQAPVKPTEEPQPVFISKDIKPAIHTNPSFVKPTTNTPTKSGKDRLASISTYLEEALDRHEDIRISYNKETKHTIIQIAIPD